MAEKVPPIAAGVPAGGSTGQVLTKASNADNDVGWAAASGIPAPADPGDNNKTLVANAGSYSWQTLGAAGGGVPSGGSANQVLKKNSATPYDYSWGTTPGAAPVGGTTGQVLTKNSASNYDYGWQTPTVLTPDWVRIVHIQGYNWYNLNTLTQLETCMNLSGDETRIKIRWQGLYGRGHDVNTPANIVWLGSNGFTYAISIANMGCYTASIGTSRWRHSYEAEVVPVRNKTTAPGITDAEYLIRDKGYTSNSNFNRDYAFTIPGYALGTTLRGFRITTTAGNEVDGGNIEVFITP